MFCNVGFADILLKDCGPKIKDGTFRKIKEGKKHEYFISFNEGKIYKVRVRSSEMIKAMQEYEGKDEEFRQYALQSGRVKNTVYQITFVDNELVTGKRLEEGTWGQYNEAWHLYEEIFINLKDNTIEYFQNSDDTLGQYMIEMNHKVNKEIYGRKNYVLKCFSEKQEDTDSDSKGSGTAFFINNRGNLITNNHVVEGCEISKINYFNKEYDTDLIATDKTLDLALLKAEFIPKSYIAFSSNEPKKRDLIIIAGYPLGKYLSDDLKINEGNISSLKGFDNNSNEITVDLAINPGNSGGPIVNENGQLVAVAVAGMSKEVTEGISFGIKSSAVTNFLKSNKISPDIKLTSFSMNDEKVNQLLEESTVYIFCE